MYMGMYPCRHVAVLSAARTAAVATHQTIHVSYTDRTQEEPFYTGRPALITLEGSVDSILLTLLLVDI